MYKRRRVRGWWGKRDFKTALVLEGPPPIRIVYQRRRYVRGGGGGGKNNLKLLRMSLEVPPPIR